MEDSSWINLFVKKKDENVYRFSIRKRVRGKEREKSDREREKRDSETKSMTWSVTWHDMKAVTQGKPTDLNQEKFLSL